MLCCIHFFIYFGNVVFTLQINYVRKSEPTQEASRTLFCQQPESGTDLPLININTHTHTHTHTHTICIFIVYVSKKSAFYLHCNPLTHTHTHTHTHVHASLVATSAITMNDVSQINCSSLPLARLRRFHWGKDSRQLRGEKKDWRKNW